MQQKSMRLIPVEHTILIFFLGDTVLITDFPCNKTLGLTATANLSLFYVTNASIIDSDFSKKFTNFSSTNYRTLRYQVLNTSNASVTYFIVTTLSKLS